MSGRRLKMPSLCQCQGCSSRRNKTEAAAARVLPPARGAQRQQPLGQSSSRQPAPRSSPRLTLSPRSSPAVNSSTGRRKVKSKRKSQNPGLVTKISVRWEGWDMMNSLENWKLVITMLALLVIVLLFPGARGEIIKVGDGHELQVTRTQSAFLIDSRAHQINLCSSVEYFSKQPLMQLQKKIEKWQKLRICVLVEEAVRRILLQGPSQNCSIICLEKAHTWQLHERQRTPSSAHISLKRILWRAETE